jgi:hypothetical protein
MQSQGGAPSSAHWSMGVKSWQARAPKVTICWQVKPSPASAHSTSDSHCLVQ